MNTPPNVTPLRRPIPKGRNLIAVASGKGGVGKTWFAVTLTHALADAGRRALLFDGDLGLANVDIQVGLMPAHDLSEVFSGKSTMRQAITSVDGASFEVVAGRSGSGSLAGIPSQRIVGVVDELLALAADYDLVVLDLGAGIDRSVRMLAGCAGRILVVTTADPTSLTDAYAFIKVTLAQEPNADIRVVINMAAAASEGRQTYAKLAKVCESFLKVRPPLAGIVRRDGRVQDSIRMQMPLLNRHPECQAAEDIRGIARQLLSEGGAA